MRQWSWAWRRKIQKYAQKARVVVGMEKENSEICPRNKSGRGHGGGKFRNMPKKQKRRGHGGGKFRNIPKKQKRRGHGGGEMENMPKKQKRRGYGESQVQICV